MNDFLGRRAGGWRRACTWMLRTLSHGARGARLRPPAILAACVVMFVLTAQLGAEVARADDTPLPSRIFWSAASSTSESPAMAAAFAVDGDPTTRWGGAFTAQHWLQVDLSDAAVVSGVLVRWDSGFAASYRIRTSIDGRA